MVQPVWKKDINGKWNIAEFSWVFSSYSNLKEWTMTSEPSIGNHLRNDFITNLFILLVINRLKCALMMKSAKDVLIFEEGSKELFCSTGTSPSNGTRDTS